MTKDNLQTPNAFFIINSSNLFPIQELKIKIGRDVSNDLVLDDIHVSRQHASLTFRRGFFWIQDLDSTSGTLVNGKKISEQFLTKGDVISIANIQLIFGQDDFPQNNDITQYQVPPKKEQDHLQTRLLSTEPTIPVSKRANPPKKE